jgi:hypothetical protein
MKSIETSIVAGLLTLFSLVGCGNSNTAAPSGEDLSHLKPDEICKQKCEQQIAAGCSNTPADYAMSCALLCESKYQKFPNCAAQSNALDACSIQRVTYSCESGTLRVSPEGACASPALACASCTGDLLQCL